MLDVIEDNDLVAHASVMGELLRHRLREGTASSPAVRAVRGRGLLVGVDLGGTARAEVTAVLDRVRENGVLIGTTGPRSDVLKIRPPLVITAQQIERVASVVSSAIDQIADC